jgi:hypothetical protein
MDGVSAYITCFFVSFAPGGELVNCQVKIIGRQSTTNTPTGSVDPAAIAAATGTRGVAGSVRAPNSPDTAMITAEAAEEPIFVLPGNEAVPAPALQLEDLTIAGLPQGRWRWMNEAQGIPAPWRWTHLLWIVKR